ncbi:effector-associated domain EAD1-containing protein [Streptomyces sp. HD]|uniref:effector-associated domain EAD1-containing protein n=1 Tax=Streptomyces sp. HD TaxID=3020892 RepID=UPI00232A9E79|nr:effector-associated domain EAD1-containing protein [Streptomyces sp. HD]
MAQESVYSKSRIHAVFSSTDLPSLKVVRELAHALAQLADQDPEEEVSRFHELWISAAREDSVVRGGEGPPLQPTLGGGLPSAREPQRADGSSTPLPNLEPYRADWSDIFESALSAVLLSLFPQKSRAYQFLDEAGLPSDYYVAGDPSTIGYWANIVEYVRSKSSVEGLERLIESAAQNSEGDQEQLRKLLQALRDIVPD